MEWICGVSYTTTGFCLRTIDGNQDEHVRPVKELQSVLATNGKLTKIRRNTSFADWRELSTEETNDLAKELGFPTGCNGQTFYEFNVEGQRYIIPAGVLMCAMFRPFHGIAKYLFAPQGLDNLCMPYGNCEKPELMFFIGSRKATGMQVDKAEGILNSLSWMHCFPSARRMWSSSLENAHRGQLNVTLPLGAIQFTGSGQQVCDGAFLICEFRVQLLTTTERPLESFSLHTRTIEFERILHKAILPKPKYAGTKDSSIPLRNGDWHITDSEWAELEPILIIRSHKEDAENARRFLNILLKKLSQGMSWTDVEKETSCMPSCLSFMIRRKADGRWDKLIAILTALRA